MSTEGVKSNKKKKNKKKVKNNFNLNLININLNNINKSSSIYYSTSDYILNVYYTFDEAVKKDLRPLVKIFYIYLLTKQAIFHGFLYKSPLEHFPLRFCLLIFILSSDLALNAIFYFDDKISEKYRYTKNIFLFALTKNVTIILLSTLIGFVLLTLFTKLSNSTNEIMEVFKQENEKLKKDNKNVVNENKKIEIKQKIEKILQKYQIKVIIFIILELLLLLFFLYYVTVFCHVYSNTQISWLMDSILSIVFRIIIDIILCFFFGKLYRIAIESNIYCIYKIALFFYSFC